MTFIAVRCPHCQSDQIVKRGKTARGTQRYLCQNTLRVLKGSFLLDYRNRGCLPEVKQNDHRHESQRQWGARYSAIIAYLSQHRAA